jgi:uncharacterized protein
VTLASSEFGDDRGNAVQTPAPTAPPRRNPIAARLRAYGTSTRIVGVDIARGLAVLGMFGAHIGVTEAFSLGQPDTWLDLVNGRSSILFAVLAGISIAIISGRQTPVAGRQLVRARVRILLRAVLIFAIGAGLQVLDTPIAVILPVYALLFVITLPFLRWRPRTLFVLAAGLAVVMPVLRVALIPRLQPGADENIVIDLVVLGAYPAMVWICFFLVGIGIGRLDLRALRVQVSLLLVGTVLAIVGYGAGVVAGWVFRPDTNTGVPQPEAYPGSIDSLWTIEPHSGTPFEIVGSTGFALAVLAVSLLAARRLPLVLFPVASVGAMALTAYAAHVVVLAALGDEAFAQPDNGLYLTFLFATLAVCTLWTILLGRGPLERLLTWASNTAASTVRSTPESAPVGGGDS